MQKYAMLFILIMLALLTGACRDVCPLVYDCTHNTEKKIKTTLHVKKAPHYSG